jgi:ADP-heptose:LPS heptosyltransferase
MREPRFKYCNKLIEENNKNTLYNSFKILTGRERRSRNPPPKTCILKFGRLGDLILATGSIRTLILEYGESCITLVISSVCFELAKHLFPKVGNIICLKDQSGASVVQDLETIKSKIGEISTLINLTHHLTSSQITLLKSFQAKYRFSLNPSHLNLYGLEKDCANLIMRRYPKYPTVRGKSMNLELEGNRILLGNVLDREIDFNEVLTTFERVARKDRTVLLCPFGSSSIRDLGAISLGPSIALLSGYGFSIKLCAPLGAERKYETFASQLNQHTGIKIDLTVVEDIKTFLHEIGSAEIVITTESAPAHIATAFDQHAIILTGGGHFGFFDSWSRSSRQKWISNPMSCFGCNWNCIQGEPICISKIPAELIQDAALEMVHHVDL